MNAQVMDVVRYEVGSDVNVVAIKTCPKTVVPHLHGATRANGLGWHQDDLRCLPKD